MRHTSFKRILACWDSKGSSTLEMVIAVPALVMLCIGMATLLGFGLRSYLYILSDWEMVDEVQYAAMTIVQKTRYAKAVKVPSSAKLQLYMQQSSKLTDTYTVETMKLTCNTQPVTGNSQLGLVNITRIYFTKKENCVRMQLRAYNRLTGHTYDIDTNIYTLGVFTT